MRTEFLPSPPRTHIFELGAPWTPEDVNLLVETDDPQDTITAVNDKTRAHWSYRPMRRPATPAVDDQAWSAHPVDAFLFARLAEKNLRPNPPANRAALLRRASYDLTGLPPTLAEIRAFENDHSPGAWKSQIERLLASPHYGEKWARHWLDIVRYAESNGFERDDEKPFVWRYRDWVVRAFNEDKPYPRFISEQLAGNELPDRDADSMARRSRSRPSAAAARKTRGGWSDPSGNSSSADSAGNRSPPCSPTSENASTTSPSSTR